MDKSKALDKIKKCLALSKSSNPHEAAAALRQAQKLMHAHDITERELGAQQQGKDVYHIAAPRGTVVYYAKKDKWLYRGKNFKGSLAELKAWFDALS